MLGSSDFFAYQHYTSTEVKSGFQGREPSHERDSNVEEASNKNWSTSNIDWLKVSIQFNCNDIFFLSRQS